MDPSPLSRPAAVIESDRECDQFDAWTARRHVLRGRYLSVGMHGYDNQVPDCLLSATARCSSTLDRWIHGRAFHCPTWGRGGLDTVGVALAFSTAVVTAIYQLLSRTLARSESTLAMLFYTAALGAVVFGACAPWFWGGARPTLQHVILFLTIGSLAGGGHFLFTAAHRDAPASILAPLQYVQLLFAGVLGWIVFGHVPDAFSILGMCLVVVAGAAVAIKSRMAES